MENIEHERKLLNILGLKFMESEDPNILVIMNQNKKQVGMIKKKKLHDRKVKKGSFGYQTRIETNKILYSGTRVLAESYKDLSFHKDNSFFYTFDVKKKNQKSCHIELDLRETPFLCIWSEEFGFMDFTMDDHRMFFLFRSTTDSFQVEETVEVEMNDAEPFDNGKEYIYQLNFCPKDNDLDDKKTRVTYLLKATAINEKEVSICEKSWKKNKLIKNKITNVEGTVSQVIRKHKDGIDAFNRFRYLINEILPLKKEIVEVMLEKRGVPEEPFTLFMPEYSDGFVEETEKTKVLK